jgi:hypothetical protein
METPTSGGNRSTPRCPSCSREQTFLTPSCKACGHRYSPEEILFIAGGLLESGMPRRSVRRQIAEAARGLAPELLDTAAGCFDRTGQGQRLACLVAVQDFGDPRALPPELLEERFGSSAPAVQAEIILTLTRAESDDALAVLERLRTEVTDGRLAAAFDDPFFRSEMLPLRSPATQRGAPAVETQDDAPPPREAEPSESYGDVEVVEVEDEPPIGSETEESSGVEVTGEDIEQEHETEPSEDDAHVRPATVPPPLPVRDPPATRPPAEPPRRAASTSTTHELESEREPPREPSTGRTLGLYLLILLLVLILGAVVAWQLQRHTGFADSLFDRDVPRQPRREQPEQAMPPPLKPPPDEAADPPPEPASHILAFEASASTQHRDFPPSNVADGDPTTVWQEERRTHAISQYLVLDFPEEVTVSRIGILAGYDEPEGEYGDMWRLNNRLKEARFEFSDGTSLTHGFEDVRDMQYFELSPPRRTESIKMTVLEVYRGSWFYDNCIAEIEIWGYEESDVAAAEPPD